MTGAFAIQRPTGTNAILLRLLTTHYSLLSTLYSLLTALCARISLFFR